jgi:flap endonuclease-1
MTAGTILGVNLRSIVPIQNFRLEDLTGKIVAIDAYNALYQFLAIIRQPDGTPLKDSTGKVTSHLSGLFYRTSNLLELGTKPIYVFDGPPPVLKRVELQRRRQAKLEAAAKYEKAVAKGKLREAFMYAQASTSMRDYMEEESKRLLSLMGLPWIQAPSEGEAQAAHLTKRGVADFCASQDYDSMLFGAQKLIRNLTISGRRKLPSKNIYVDVTPELVDLTKPLTLLGLTQEQLIDVAILTGTDFNPDGIKGLGPKTALKLVKQYGNLKAALPYIKNADFPVDPEQIREIFTHPQVTDSYQIEWKNADDEGIVDFLVRQKDFSEDRVRKALQRTQENMEKLKGKTTLEKWFG